MRKALIPIYGITFIDVLGFTIMIPILPYLTKHYGAPDFVVGTLMTTMALCSAIAAPIWGGLSDRFGRRRIVMISQVFSLVGYVVIGISQTIGMIFVSRVVAGLGGGNLAVAQSYIADVTEEKDRNQAYAFYGVSFGVGFIIGPVLGGFLVHYGFAVPFLVAASLEALNLLFTYTFLPKSKRKGQAESPTGVRVREVVEVLRRVPEVRTVLMRHFLFIFAVTYFFSAFALYLDHVLHTKPSETSWLLAGCGAAGGLVQVVIITPLTRRFGDRYVSEVGFVMNCTAYVLLAFVHDVALFVGVLLIWAIGSALIEPTLTTLLADAAPVEERGAVLGVNDSINNAALIIAPALGSYMVGVDAHAVGWVPAVCSIVALGIGIIANRRAAREHRPDPGIVKPQRAANTAISEDAAPT